MRKLVGLLIFALTAFASLGAWAEKSKVTGWVSDEDPVHIAARKAAEEGFHPPLDIVDGAARIVDPIISGINSGEHLWGQFLKDYRPTDW